VPYGWDNNVTYHLTLTDSNNAEYHQLLSLNKTDAKNMTKSKITSQGTDNDNDPYGLTERIENMLTKAAAILEATSKLPEMRNIIFQISLIYQLT
jgi:hypothetical protein